MFTKRAAFVTAPSQIIIGAAHGAAKAYWRACAINPRCIGVKGNAYLQTLVSAAGNLRETAIRIDPIYQDGLGFRCLRNAIMNRAENVSTNVRDPLTGMVCQSVHQFPICSGTVMPAIIRHRPLSVGGRRRLYLIIDKDDYVRMALPVLRALTRWTSTAFIEDHSRVIFLWGAFRRNVPFVRLKPI